MHKPAGDGRFGGALRVAVLAGFVVAAGCAALLMVGRSSDTDASARDAGCGRLCAAGGPTATAATPDGTAPAAAPGHQGRSVPEGSATPPAGATSGIAPGATASAPRSGSAAAAATPATSGPAPAHPVTFKVTGSWSTGYQVDVIVANDTAVPEAGWKLVLKPGGTPVVHPPVSNGTVVTGADGSLTITPADWNATIAPGGQAVVNIGFDGAYVAPNPADCVLDGQPCTMQILLQKN